MGSRQKAETPDVIAAKLAQGRGMGVGADYRPWIEVGEFRCAGEKEIIHGIKIRRDHHYFSFGESKHHYLMEYLPQVVDIREQFPLLPLSHTVEVAREAGIDHPKFLGKPKVLTLDFLLTIRGATGDVLTARSVKTSDDLRDQRTLEKQRLEKLVCESFDIPHRIVTEKQLTRTMALNLQFLRKWNSLPLRPPPLPAQSAAFVSSLSRQRYEGTLLICTEN